MHMGASPQATLHECTHTNPAPFNAPVHHPPSAGLQARCARPPPSPHTPGPLPAHWAAARQRAHVLSSAGAREGDVNRILHAGHVNLRAGGGALGGGRGACAAQAGTGRSRQCSAQAAASGHDASAQLRNRAHPHKLCLQRPCALCTFTYAPFTASLAVVAAPVTFSFTDCATPCTHARTRATRATQAASGMGQGMGQGRGTRCVHAWAQAGGQRHTRCAPMLRRRLRTPLPPRIQEHHTAPALPLALRPSPTFTPAFSPAGAGATRGAAAGIFWAMVRDASFSVSGPKWGFCGGASVCAHARACERVRVPACASVHVSKSPRHSPLCGPRPHLRLTDELGGLVACVQGVGGHMGGGAEPLITTPTPHPCLHSLHRSHAALAAACCTPPGVGCRLPAAARHCQHCRPPPCACSL